LTRILCLSVLLACVASTAYADDPPAPFAWGDFTWMNGQSRQKDFPLQFNKAITLSVYVDAYYAFSLNHPSDDTLWGSSTLGRSNELQINLASIGLEWNWRHVIGRFSLQYGSMLNIVQDQDASVNRGANISLSSLRYIREAALGWHWDRLAGINLEGGIFLSYMGLESYLLAENWLYTRSLVCDATPFYFSGLRLQIFPTTKMKVELWLTNGWQTYAKWSFAPSGGLALRWSPREWLSLIANFYVGTDTLDTPHRVRFHNDDSIVMRLWNRPASRALSKLAFSLNGHGGFEGGGANLPGPSEAWVAGFAFALRAWFLRDFLALTARAEYFANPSRYLAPLPPPGLANDGTTTLAIYGFTGSVEIMPTDFFSVRAEVNWRRANVGYFAGPGGTTADPLGDAGPSLRRDQTLLLLAANFRL
jgi:hypothetical protein